MEFKKFFIINEAEIVLNEAEQSLNWSKYIDSRTGKKWRQEQKIDQLRAIVNSEVAKGTPPNKIWLTFSNLPKLGINPTSGDHGAPQGIYAYPTSYIIRRNGKVPYGGDRTYMIVFKVKGSVLKAEPEEVDKKKMDTLTSTIKKTLGNPLDTSLKMLELKLSDYIEEKILPKYMSKGDSTEVENFISVGKDLINRFIANLVEIYRDKRDAEVVKEMLPKSVEEFKKTTQKEARNRLEKIFSNLTFGYDDDDYKKKYDLNDDDTVSLTPQYEKFLKNKKEESPYGEMPVHSFIGKKFSINNVYELEHGAYNINYYLKYYDNIKKYIDSAPMRALLKGLLFKLKKFFEKYKAPDLTSVKFPFRQQLTELAKKYGLNLEKAIREGLLKSNITGFVYKVTHALAEQMVMKQMITNDPKSSQPVWWNKFIRELGISSVIDPQGTGTVHPAESTQGAFFDVSKLEQIAVIENKQSNVDTTERTGRPPFATPESVYNYYIKQGLSHEDALQLSKEPFRADAKWDDDKHFRQQLKPQRAGWKDAPSPFNNSGQIGHERALIQLYSKIKRIRLQLNKYGHGYSMDDYQSVEAGDLMRLSSYLVVLTKLLKSVKAISDSGIEYTKDGRRALDLTNQEVTTIRELLWNMSKGSNLPPEEEQQLTYIIGGLSQFLSGQTAKTPIFSRIPQWKSAKIHNAFNQYADE